MEKYITQAIYFNVISLILYIFNSNAGNCKILRYAVIIK